MARQQLQDDGEDLGDMQEIDLPDDEEVEYVDEDGNPVSAEDLASGDYEVEDDEDLADQIQGSDLDYSDESDDSEDVADLSDIANYDTPQYQQQQQFQQTFPQQQPQYQQPPQQPRTQVLAPPPASSGGLVNTISNMYNGLNSGGKKLWNAAEPVAEKVEPVAANAVGGVVNAGRGVVDAYVKYQTMTPQQKMDLAIQQERARLAKMNGRVASQQELVRQQQQLAQLKQQERQIRMQYPQTITDKVLNAGSKAADAYVEYQKRKMQEQANAPKKPSLTDRLQQQYAQPQQPQQPQYAQQQQQPQPRRSMFDFGGSGSQLSDGSLLRGAGSMAISDGSLFRSQGSGSMGMSDGSLLRGAGNGGSIGGASMFNIGGGQASDGSLLRGRGMDTRASDGSLFRMGNGGATVKWVPDFIGGNQQQEQPRLAPDFIGAFGGRSAPQQQQLQQQQQPQRSSCGCSSKVYNKPRQTTVQQQESPYDIQVRIIKGRPVPFILVQDPKGRKGYIPLSLYQRLQYGRR